MQGAPTGGDADGGRLRLLAGDAGLSFAGLSFASPILAGPTFSTRRKIGFLARNPREQIVCSAPFVGAPTVCVRIARPG